MFNTALVGCSDPTSSRTLFPVIHQAHIKTAQVLSVQLSSGRLDRTYTNTCLSIFKSFPTSSFSLVPVLQSWDVFFRNANAGAPPGAAYQSPLALSAASSLVAPQLSSLVGAQPNVEKLVEDHLAVQSLIRAYQVHANTRVIQEHVSAANRMCILTKGPTKSFIYCFVPPSVFGDLPHLCFVLQEPVYS